MKFRLLVAPLSIVSIDMVAAFGPEADKSGTVSLYAPQIFSASSDAPDKPKTALPEYDELRVCNSFLPWSSWLLTGRVNAKRCSSVPLMHL